MLFYSADVTLPPLTLVQGSWPSANSLGAYAAVSGCATHYSWLHEKGLRVNTSFSTTNDIILTFVVTTIFILLSYLPFLDNAACAFNLEINGQWPVIQ